MEYPYKVSKVLVFTPTFNEAENIKMLIDQIKEVSQNLDILVIDDSSTDLTTKILEQESSKDSSIQVIVRSLKSGVGSAHMLGIKEAHKRGYDYFITMDADLSHNPKDIPRFLNGLINANYVVGTRSRGGKTELKGIRLVLSKGANLLCRYLLPTGLSEYTNGFRAYDRSAINVLMQNPPKGSDYSFFIEVSNTLFLSGLAVTEIPIVFRNRFAGDSKIPPFQIFLSMNKIVRLFIMRILT
jgi:dolichol-phosphate mannosyltransferase